MIRFLRTMIWVRLRILVHSMQGGHRRDSMEQLSRIAAALVPIVGVLMIVPSTLGLATAGFLGGRWMARAGASQLAVIGPTRVVMALATIAVVTAPLVRSVRGGDLNLTRLLLLPIPRRVLHVSEMVAVLADPWVGVMVPGVLALGVGLAFGGAWAAGLLGLVGAVALLVVLAALGALCSTGAMLAFRDRRRAELLTFVLVALLSLLGFVGPLVDGLLDRQDRPGPAGETTAAAPRNGPDVERALGWARGFPSEMFGRSLARAADGDLGGAVPPLLGLVGMGALLVVLSGAAHRRLLDNPDAGSSRRAAGRAEVRASRIPGLPPGASAVALAQARTALRTVRGKMAVYFTFAFVVLLHLAVANPLSRSLPSALAVGPLLVLVGGALTWLSLQPILLNQFAVDGAGLTLQFLTPLRDLDIVRGKIAGCGILGGVSLGLCLGAAVALSPTGSPLLWIAMLLVCLSSYALLAPCCTLLSILLPKTADLSRLGKAGNPHAVSGLVSLPISAIAVAPGLGLYLLGALAIGSPAITLSLVTGWTLLATLLGIPLTHLAASATTHRRENLALVATGK